MRTRRYGLFRVAVMFDFGSVGVEMREVMVDVVDEELDAVDMDESPSAERAQPVWDGKARTVIPALSSARPYAGHIHTPDDVQWHPNRPLRPYSIPDDLQVPECMPMSVPDLGRFPFQCAHADASMPAGQHRRV